MRRAILDVDVGVDDFLAVLILLNAEKKAEVKIEAIVCSVGNTTVENVCKNVVRLLELAKSTHVSTTNRIVTTLLEHLQNLLCTNKLSFAGICLGFVLLRLKLPFHASL